MSSNPPESLQIRDKRGGDRYFIDNSLIKEWGPKIGVYGIAVYNILAMHANNDTQEAFPSYNTIARLTGASRRKVVDTVTMLHDLGIIQKTTRRGDDGEYDSNVILLLNKECWGGKIDLSLCVGDAQNALGSAGDAPPDAGNALPTHSEQNALVQDVHGGSAGDAPKQDSPNKTQKTKKRRTKSKPIQTDISSDPVSGPTPAQVMFGTLAEICQVDLGAMTEKQRGELNQAEKVLRDTGATPTDLLGFSAYWFEFDWRGKQGQPPSPTQARAEWGRYKGYLASLRPEPPPAPLPDHLAQRVAPAPEPITAERRTWEQIADCLSGMMTKGAYEAHVKNAQAVARQNGTLTVMAASAGSYEIVCHQLAHVFNRAANQVETGLKIEFVLGAA